MHHVDRSETMLFRMRIQTDVVALVEIQPKRVSQSGHKLRLKQIEHLHMAGNVRKDAMLTVGNSKRC